MSRKHQLREQRAGTIINLTSQQQEKAVGKALSMTVEAILNEFDFELRHDTNWYLKDIVERLRSVFPEVEFHCHHSTSSIKPDGGILSLIAKGNGVRHPILITEVKNQGTNDLRAAEGKPKQARGNAIERLGKNVIGIRAAMRTEGIVPFVCFGDGCDFEPASSILDRVTTIAMFGPLNTTHVVNSGPNEHFNRGSFYFRSRKWTVAEMHAVMLDVARRSIHYYLARYGDDFFSKRNSPAG